MGSTGQRMHMLQSLNPGRWILAGEVDTDPSEEALTRDSLSLIRKTDSLSPKIKGAIASKTLLPYIEIATQLGRAQLWNARVTSVERDKHSLEKEVIEFTFQKIELTNNKGNKSSTDDWLSS